MNKFNKVIIFKGEQIPISRSEMFEVPGDYTEYLICEITESVAPEEDLKWVNIIWEGKLELSNPLLLDMEILSRSHIHMMKIKL